MNQNLIISMRIEISAVARKVWDVLISPEKIKIYLFGTNTLTDWKKGSDIIFEGEYQGQSYRDKGKIVEIKKNVLLQYTYWSGFSGLEDKPENYSLVSFRLDELDDKTTLTFSQKGFASDEARQHSQLAWTNIMKQIKELSEQD